MARLNLSIIGLLATTFFGLGGFTTAFFSRRGNLTQSSSSSRSRRVDTSLHDSMTDIEYTKPNIFYFDEVDSTMTKARELIPLNAGKSSFAVVSGHQSSGKGTRGRTWVSGQGNLFLTVVLKVSAISTPLTLFPLRVGTLVIPSIQSRVTSGALTKLKWPNDVLIGEEKVCGVLIEIEGDFILIGIGCNVMTAPVVDSVGPENGRQATCLIRHIAECNVADASESSSSSSSGIIDNQVTMTSLDTCPSLGELHKEIAAEIYGALSSYALQHNDTTEQVIADFERYMNFSPQQLRGDTSAGRTVTPLRVNKDGTLQVESSDDGTEKTLVAEYLW